MIINEEVLMNLFQQVRQLNRKTLILGALTTVVVVAAVGAIAWRYNNGALTSSADEATLTIGTISLKDLEATFAYPGSVDTKADRSGKTSVSKIDSQTTDSLSKVYDYYLALATKQKLTVSQKNMDANTALATIMIQGSGYSSNVFISKETDTKTNISINFYGSEIKVDTTE
jgi:hypothetical protein